MGQTDHVTDFKLDRQGKGMVTIQSLVTAVGLYLGEQLDGETFCCPAAWDNKDEEIPYRFRWLVAFAVEGENEADYVHFGAIIQGEYARMDTVYKDFGFAKVWCGPRQARIIANEVQRFLNASRWN